MPNTQGGLPWKDHLWKLPSLGTQPTSPRCALAFPRGFATDQIHCDELLVIFCCSCQMPALLRLLVSTASSGVKPSMSSRNVFASFETS